jgi:hypothetical protein
VHLCSQCEFIRTGTPVVFHATLGKLDTSELGAPEAHLDLFGTLP